VCVSTLSVGRHRGGAAARRLRGGILGGGGGGGGGGVWLGGGGGGGGVGGGGGGCMARVSEFGEVKGAWVIGLRVGTRVRSRSVGRGATCDTGRSNDPRE